MDNTEKQFISLLSSGIRNKDVFKKYDDVNWNEVLQLAKLHKTEGIIFQTLSRSGLINNIEKKDLNEIKINTFKTGVNQIRGINYLYNILNIFNEVNIKVIVLKGLVIREFYPKPEHRSMCDADILIHKEDLDKTKIILLNLGYVLDKHEASHHIKFTHDIYPVIEVHWHLFKRDGFNNNLDIFESSIWENSICITMGTAKVLSLNYEDLALHLCMHMAAHLVSSGFGVRQLCDLCLLIEAKGKEMNWESFMLKSSLYGFERFNSAIILVCNKLFDVEIPSGIKVDRVINDRNIDKLISEIIDSGVHGKKDMVSNFGNQLAFNFDNKENESNRGVVKRFIRFIFPRVEVMNDKYSYAEKNIVLLPIAWMHHFFTGVFSREYRIKEKIKFLFFGFSISARKNKLLKWLEL